MVGIEEFASSIGEYLGIEILETDYQKDFAEVGVDSLRAYMLIERLEKQYKVVLLDESPYDYNTIEKLYKIISNKIEDNL